MVQTPPSGRPYRPSPRGDAQVQQRVQAVVVTATVSPLDPKRPTPTGTVTVFVDNVPTNRSAQLDNRGRARVRISGLKPGKYNIRATYSGGGTYDYHSSASPSLVYAVGGKP
jgi:hypothetical protein